MVDCLYEITSMIHFAKLSIDEIPYETTILNFRHFNGKAPTRLAMFDAINPELETEGLLMKTLTIVDATFINEPTSTKKKGKTRNSEMRSSKKGNTLHFGMKLHTGTI